MTCENWDWAITGIVTTVCIIFYFWQRDVQTEKWPQFFATTVFLVYLLNYVFVGFLSGLITQEAYHWLAAVAIVVVVMLGMIAKKEIFATAAFILMVSQGLPLSAALIVSLLWGGIVFAIFFLGKVEELTDLFFMSLVLAADVSLGLVSMFSNAAKSSIPLGCTSRQINMLLVCDEACQSVVADDSTVNRSYWIIATIVFGSLRFGYFFYKDMCNKPSEITEEDKRSCCRCWQKTKYTAAIDVTQNPNAALNKNTQSVGPKRQTVEDDDDENEGDENSKFAIDDVCEGDNADDKSGGDEGDSNSGDVELDVKAEKEEEVAAPAPAPAPASKKQEEKEMKEEKRQKKTVVHEKKPTSSKEAERDLESALAVLN